MEVKNLQRQNYLGEDGECVSVSELCKNYTSVNSAKSNMTTEVSFFDCLDKFNLSSVEDLYHEYEDLDWSSFPESIVVPVLFGIVFFAGLLGNGIVIFVVARSGFASKKNITNLYFGNLALADLCFLIVCVPTTAMTYLLPSWPFGPHMCKYKAFN